MERKAVVGRRRDPIWEHVKQQSDGYFNCNYCKESYKGGATRIKSHLTGEKGSGIRACPSSPLNPKNEAPTLGGTTSSSQEMIPFHNNPTPSTSFVVENSNEALVDKLIVEFLISNKLPLETIEQPCFRNLLSEVARVRPGYQLPANCSSLFKESIPIVKDVLQYIQIVLNSCNKYGCTLVIHLKPEVEFLYEFSKVVDPINLVSGIQVYSPEGVICTYKLDPSDSDLGQLIHEVNKAITQYEVTLLFNKHKFCTKNWYTDFMYGLPFRSRGVYGCAIEDILTLLNDMCEKIGWVSMLLSDVEDSYMNLPRAQQESSYGTAWKTYDHPLFKLQAVIQHRTNLDDELWEEKTNLIKAVGPLLHMLTLFDNFVPNFGYFYGAIRKAESWLKHFFDRQREKKFGGLLQLFTEFKSQVLGEIHKVAAYLNPGYMFDNKNLPPSNIYQDFWWILVNGSLSEYEDFEKQRGLYDRMDPSLFSEEAKSKLHTYHPVRWWQEFGGTVPLLQNKAIRILSQRVNCLSHFSHKHKFERQLDMLSMNTICMEEFGKLKQSDDIFKPIDLNILDTSFKL